MTTSREKAKKSAVPEKRVEKKPAPVVKAPVKKATTAKTIATKAAATEEVLPVVAPRVPKAKLRGIIVVGSIHMDITLRTETIPQPGETVMGQDLLQGAGGKGANQAAAAGKLWKGPLSGGGGVRLLARVGKDAYGEECIHTLTKSRVDISHVQLTPVAPTGTALIVVDRHGENAIVVASGANRELSATDILSRREALEEAAVVMAQMEVSADTVVCAFALAKRGGAVTILDPAPVPSEGLPEALYHVDILTPNQTEAERLSGVAVRTVEDARRASEHFLRRGTGTVIVKMGSLGAAIVKKNARGETELLHMPGHRVQAVDTTGAGDAFNGALAVKLAEGALLPAAVAFANVAGALACTKVGAMAAMANRESVEKAIEGVAAAVAVGVAVGVKA